MSQRNLWRQINLIRIRRRRIAASVKLIVTYVGRCHCNRRNAITHKLQTGKPLLVSDIVSIIEICIKFRQSTGSIQQA